MREVDVTYDGGERRMTVLGKDKGERYKVGGSSAARAASLLAPAIDYPCQ